MNFAYHVTPRRNLDSILKKGIRKQCGDNRVDDTELGDAVFLFPDEESLYAGLDEWMFETYEGEPLYCLVIDITGLEPIKNHLIFGSEELAFDESIPSSRIKGIIKIEQR